MRIHCGQQTRGRFFSFSFEFVGFTMITGPAEATKDWSDHPSKKSAGGLGGAVSPPVGQPGSSRDFVIF